jgi:hypothetical protein
MNHWWRPACTGQAVSHLSWKTPQFESFDECQSDRLLEHSDMCMARIGVLALAIVWQFAIPVASQSHELTNISQVPTAASQPDLDSVHRGKFHRTAFTESLHSLPEDLFFNHRKAWELVDALVHVHSARNATALRELRKISGSKFNEYVSHNTFAIVTPAGSLAQRESPCS